MHFFTPSEEPSDNWPEIRAEATILARERIARYELERASRLAEYARRWPGEERTERGPVLVWSKEVAR
jgi:hypothetical protein